MKNNKILYLFLIFLLFSITFVIAEEKDPYVDENGNIQNMPQNIDPLTQQNLNNLASYIHDNFPNIDGTRATLKIDDVTGEIVVINAQTKNEFARIPKGFEVKNEGGNFVIKGSSEQFLKGYEKETTGSIGKEVPIYEELNLVIDGNYFLVRKSKGEIATISLKKKIIEGSTVKSIVFDGTGEVIGSYHSAVFKKKAVYTISGEGDERVFDLKGEGDLIINGADIKNLKDSVIRVDKNKQIIYADLKFTQKSSFSFNNKDRYYSIEANSNSEFFFDLKNKIISGKRIIIQSPEGEINGASLDGFKISLNEDGSFSSAALGKDDIFRPYYGGLGIFSSVGKKEAYSVFFKKFPEGKESLKDFDGNAIFIGENSVEMKGLIRRNNYGVTYESTDKTTYTVVSDFSGKKDFYDVIEGSAKIRDFTREVIIKDGESFYKILTNNDAHSTDFGFSYKNKAGEKVVGEYQGWDGSFVVKIGDNKEIVIKKDSLNLQNSQMLSLLGDDVKMKSISRLEGEIKALDENIKSGSGLI